MFGLRKRIEELEIAEKQRNCDHSWGSINVRFSGRNRVYAAAKCGICGKRQERSGCGEELSVALLTLDDFFKGIVRTETDIKPKPKK